MKKMFLWSLLSIIMMAAISAGLSSCSSDDDDDEGGSSSIPSELIGSWHKESGDYHYSMNFTFNQDGTGKGSVYMNRIISHSHFAFTYKYSSNGTVTCNGSRVMVDEEGEETVSTNFTFKHSEGKLTWTKAPNGNWEGAVLVKD